MSLDPASMKVAELRVALDERGLDSVGTKAVLQERLREALENEASATDAAPAEQQQQNEDFSDHQSDAGDGSEQYSQDAAAGQEEPAKQEAAPRAGPPPPPQTASAGGPPPPPPGAASSATKAPATKPAPRSNVPQTPLPVQVADGDSIPADCKVFVGGMPYEASEDQLMRHFYKFGPVAANIVRDRDTQRSKGFGFVCFKSAATASEAMLSMHDTEFNGRKIRTGPATRRAGEDGDKPRGDRSFGRQDRTGQRSRGAYSTPAAASSGMGQMTPQMMAMMGMSGMNPMAAMAAAMMQQQQMGGMSGMGGNMNMGGMTPQQLQQMQQMQLMMQQQQQQQQAGGVGAAAVSPMGMYGAGAGGSQGMGGYGGAQMYGQGQGGAGQTPYGY